MRIRHTPRTLIYANPPPGNRTRPCGFEYRRASDTLAGTVPDSALARNRTWSTTFGGSRAIPAHSKGDERWIEQGCKDLNPVREFWRLAALPGAHPCLSLTLAEPALAHASASAGSWARNLAQLSIAGALRGVERLPLGPTGRRRSRMPACSGARSPLRALHASQAATQLVQLDVPPCDRGRTWSIVIDSAPGCAPQYWQM